MIGAAAAVVDLLLAATRASWVLLISIAGLRPTLNGASGASSEYDPEVFVARLDPVPNTVL